ncbi:2OG-Fe(II) oxygenase [Piscinibacter sakaiensis]|uniref:2OG-Fe(II) oxygenase n=1 Tax=Piscinibacter sakaiensis TaxID=1547922 RepID=UPI003AABC898
MSQTSSSTQVITEELRQWIVEQATSGQPPDAVLQSMLASGWNEDVAIVALEETLRGFLSEHALKNGLPPPVVVPEPMSLDRVPLLDAGDRKVPVLASMLNPRIVVLGQLLSDDECDELIEQARARLHRSETVKLDNGGSEVNEARTSEGMFFERGQTPLCRRIEERIAELVSWPVVNGEGLQVLRYGPGAEYKPHYDYFDPAQPGTPSILKRGGQRVASLVIYLNTPERGGSTVFPDVRFEVAPIKGNAVFFSYDRPHPMTRSLHGGTPVLAGEKWVATKWLREGRFD